MIRPRRSPSRQLSKRRPAVTMRYSRSRPARGPNRGFLGRTANQKPTIAAIAISPAPTLIPSARLSKFPFGLSGFPFAGSSVAIAVGLTGVAAELGDADDGLTVKLKSPESGCPSVLETVSQCTAWAPGPPA